MVKKDWGGKHIPMKEWGKDHWSAFAYLETIAVDHKGFAKPDMARMRTNHKTHGGLGSLCDGSKYGTRLRFHSEEENFEIVGHDDWDCADDMVHEGLLVDVGSGINRAYTFTKYGLKVVAALREHKQKGKNYCEFKNNIPWPKECED